MLLQSAIEPWVGERAPFALFYLAVTISAMFGGAGAAILATSLSIPTVFFFFMEPRYTFIAGHPTEVPALILFFIVTVPTSLAGYQLNRSRARLQDSLRAFRRQTELLKQSPGAIIIRAPDGTIRWWGPGAELLYGWSSEEATGRVAHELLHTEFPAEFSELNAQVQQGSDWKGELRQRTKTGSVVIVSSAWHAAKTDGVLDIIETNVDITERVKAQKDQAMLASIIESSHDAILSEDLDGIILSMNAGAERIFGFIAEQVVGKSLATFVSPEYAPSAQAILDRFRRGEQTVRYERTEQTRDRGKIELSVTVSPIRNSKGELIGLSRIAQDITERKRAERELRESEVRYHSILENMSEGLIITDAYGKVVYENPASVQMHHLTFQSSSETARLDRESVEGRWQVFDLERRPLVFDQFPITRILRGEHLREQVVRVRNRETGLEFVASFNGRTTVDEQGAVQFAFLTIRDISEEVRIREEIEARERTFRGVVESNMVGTFFWNVDGRITSANNRLLEMIGYTHEDLASGQLYWKALTPPEFTEADAIAINEVIATGIVKIPYEKEFVRKDGTRIPILITGAILDPNRHEGVSHVLDITDRKRLEKQLGDALQRAEAANSAKDQFLAVLSHELRTPLSPVFVAIELIQRQDGLTAQSKNLLEVIRRNVAMEVRLIEDLLDLTRIVQGKISLHKERLNIADVLSRVADVCRPDIEAKGIHFGIRLKESSLPVFGDSSRLQQVFWNLIKNSVKFTERGGDIDVRSYIENSSVVVEVRDKGIGIEPALLPRIFDAFEQGGEQVTRQFGGLGLGLAITKRLVEMHDGRVTVESEGKGKGATFRVSLPLDQQEAIGQRIAPAERDAAAAPHRILLVEDHKDTSALMSMLLESHGHTVDVADNVADALKAASAHQYELLICDIGLPDKSGLDLMRELRRSGNTLKGIALSGYGRDEDIQSSMEAGFTEHLTKPVDINVLENAVERVAAGSY